MEPNEIKEILDDTNIETAEFNPMENFEVDDTVDISLMYMQ